MGKSPNDRRSKSVSISEKLLSDLFIKLVVSVSAILLGLLLSNVQEIKSDLRGVADEQLRRTDTVSFAKKLMLGDEVEVNKLCHTIITKNCEGEN